MDTSLNIVELIENNPITKLSSSYNGKLLTKIQEGFTNFEQQLFVSSFYCYLNCDQKNDFVIDLDNVWKWLGFSQKDAAKRILIKQFGIDNDYKFLLHSKVEQVPNNLALEGFKAKKSHGGHNKEIIMLTVKTFKSLCLKAGTKKADEIHDYYLKMEEIIHKVVQEESDELKIQLDQKDKELEQAKNEIVQVEGTAEQTKRKAVELSIIQQFPVNVNCIYFGTIDNKTIDGFETLIKFGKTNDLRTRVYNHRGEYENFILVNAFKVHNSTHIENLIKSNKKIKKQLRKIKVNEKQHIEILAYDDNTFTIDNLTHHIKQILIQYSYENFELVLEEKGKLEVEMNVMREKIDTLEKSNLTKSLLIEELKTTTDEQQKQINLFKQEHQAPVLEKDEQTKRFDEFIDSCCIVHNDVEESSTIMEGQFRIWNRTKPSKETFHLFKQYLDTRFRPKRLQKQDKNQIVHGYAGVKLLPIEYKRVNDISCDVETFLFQVCRFSPCGKILNSTLLNEYQRWKKKLNKEIKTDDMREIKDYLNSSLFTQKGTVWVNNSTNEGYYGLSLREDDEYEHKITSSTGKKVNKVCMTTNQIINSWDTIIKAATNENMSAAKMSRSIKNKTENNGFFYSTS
jgi:hypothetical protein